MTLIQDKWKEMVACSRENIEDFRDFLDDKATVWANKEMNNYQKAMLFLVKSNENWEDLVTEDQAKFIKTMIRRAESYK